MKLFNRSIRTTKNHDLNFFEENKLIERYNKFYFSTSSIDVNAFIIKGYFGHNIIIHFLRGAYCYVSEQGCTSIPTTYRIIDNTMSQFFRIGFTEAAIFLNYDKD
ncbi:hypothetical protein CGK38_03260 [Vibrio parahaemolyticus]|nr:hypothetical protein CGK38_03260 [Vibrio parahaemolyticus]